MEFESEIWKLDYGLYKIYTDRKSVLNTVKRITSNEIAATYYKKGREIGWDMIFETKHLAEIKRQLRVLKKK